MMKRISLLLILIVFCIAPVISQLEPVLQYRVFLDDAKDHIFHVELIADRVNDDTVYMAMPLWTPGYYGLMDFPESVTGVAAVNSAGNNIPVNNVDRDTWQVISGDDDRFILKYNVKATRKFVAQSYIDSSHAYIVPGNNFMYIEGMLDIPVSVEIVPGPLFSRAISVSGMEKAENDKNTFIDADFDKLYDSPVLTAEMEELPPFYVEGIRHRFIGYKIGDFNHDLFIDELRKIVESAVTLMGDIPYEEYTFIAIGPGRGGIEHLNNTTISFDGSRLGDRRSMLGTLNFLAHEYFHHYNVKRIRPYELGPFDYSKANRTNQLWVSEGLTVYYEYVLTRLSGLASREDFISAFEGLINSLENNEGRFKQSLAQSSYYTWEAGPFGNPGETISYYEKGTLVGMIIDLAIRHSSENRKSMDDVMRYVYNRYYKELDRGFTDAEFQEACELIAGTSLSEEFEYVYTTRELDYNRYLNYAGLELEKTTDENGKVHYSITALEQPGALQNNIQEAWLRGQD